MRWIGQKCTLFRTLTENGNSDVIICRMEKVGTYNLNYRDRAGNKRPVRFSSYVWKRIDGLAIDFLRHESRMGGRLKEDYLADNDD